MGEIGGDVALDELHREVGLGVEVMEERSLGARRLGDHLVDRRRVVALIGHQPLGDLQDPFAGRAAVSRHILHCTRLRGLLKQTEQSETRTEMPMSTALPQLSGRPVVTDGGLETDLIYHHGARPAGLRGVSARRRRARPRAAASATTATTSTSPGGPGGGAARHADVAGQRRLGRPTRLSRSRATPGEPRRGRADRAAAQHAGLDDAR